MSDSTLSDDPGTPVPSDNELEQSLRREVFKATKVDDEVTVRRIRAASEKKLGLPDDFYKNHATWKDKSKAIIEDQVNNETDIPNSPVLKKAKPAKSTKRRSEEPEEVPKKKRKVSKKESSDELSSPASDAGEESEPKERPRKAAKKEKVPVKSNKGPTSKRSVKDTNAEEPSDDGKEEDSKLTEGNHSESDLSVLIDEEPTKKKRGKNRDSQDNSKKPKSKTTTKAKTEEHPDQAEIKRLQGWLVKCGIRKVWGKELKPYETPKAKIKHLKDMLSDAGMTGRYSVEKATQIKDAREMAADLEAVKEGEERWGADDSKDADDASGDEARPQRKLVRGSKHFDFLSSDGEETD